MSARKWADTEAWNSTSHKIRNKEWELFPFLLLLHVQIMDQYDITQEMPSDLNISLNRVMNTVPLLIPRSRSSRLFWQGEKPDIRLLVQWWCEHVQDRCLNSPWYVILYNLHQRAGRDSRVPRYYLGRVPATTMRNYVIDTACSRSHLLFSLPEKKIDRAQGIPTSSFWILFQGSTAKNKLGRLNFIAKCSCRPKHELYVSLVALS
jgi:hypothetical protein